jgi:uncharacterized membrane protein YhaH (DUF805 family)
MWPTSAGHGSRDSNALATLLPTLAVVIRRLHDTNKSGWWWLITFVPFVGGLVLLMFECLPGDQGPNQYGPDPKGALTQAYPQYPTPY